MSGRPAQLAAWGAVALLLAAWCGFLGGGFLLADFSREVLARYQGGAASMARNCGHEMNVRGELGLVQQELELNGGGLEKQGITGVQVVSRTGLVLLHSDGERLGETLPLTVLERRALEGRTMSRLSGRGEGLRLTVTVPVASYDQVWGVLSLTMRPKPEHELALRLSLVRRRTLVLAAVISLAALLGWIHYGWRLWRRSVGALGAQEALLRERQLAGVGTGLAHEVKNALNGICLNAQLLRECGGELGRGTARKLDRIEGEARRAGEMLADFLNYAGQQEFNPAPLNLAALLKEIHQFFAEAGAKENVTVELELQEGLNGVLAEEKSLRQAVTNLLWNALQATAGAGGGRVLLSCGVRGGQVEIAVEDEGPGVPPEIAGRIFEAFYTTKEKGVGLGLAVAQKAAAVHGGSLSLRTPKKGRGALFTLSIPYLPKERHD